LDAIGFPISPTLAVTLADQLGLAGFGLACISLIWQGTTWFLGNRVRLKVRLFRPKWNRENLVVECVQYEPSADRAGTTGLDSMG